MHRVHTAQRRHYDTRTGTRTRTPARAKETHHKHFSCSCAMQCERWSECSVFSLQRILRIEWQLRATDTMANAIGARFYFRQFLFIFNHYSINAGYVFLCIWRNSVSSTCLYSERYSSRKQDTFHGSRLIACKNSRKMIFINSIRYETMRRCTKAWDCCRTRGYFIYLRRATCICDQNREMMDEWMAIVVLS